MSYTIFRKLETGELLQVATRDDFNQAERLAQSLAEHWPAEYPVWDSSSAAEVERRTKRSASQTAYNEVKAAPAKTSQSPSDAWEIT